MVKNYSMTDDYRYNRVDGATVFGACCIVCGLIAAVIVGVWVVVMELLA